MTLDDRLRALRDIIQVDPGNRGLARDPQRNLFNGFPDDFAQAIEGEDASHRRQRGGDEQAVIAPRVAPDDGGRGEPAQPVGEQPLITDVGV